MRQLPSPAPAQRPPQRRRLVQAAAIALAILVAVTVFATASGRPAPDPRLSDVLAATPQTDGIGAAVRQYEALRAASAQRRSAAGETPGADVLRPLHRGGLPVPGPATGLPRDAAQQRRAGSSAGARPRRAPLVAGAGPSAATVPSPRRLKRDSRQASSKSCQTGSMEAARIPAGRPCPSCQGTLTALLGVDAWRCAACGLLAVRPPEVGRALSLLGVSPGPGELTLQPSDPPGNRRLARLQRAAHPPPRPPAVGPPPGPRPIELRRPRQVYTGQR